MGFDQGLLLLCSNMLCLIVEDHIVTLSNADCPGANELLKPSDTPERHIIESREITC
jgi:hypothetical protein